MDGMTLNARNAGCLMDAHVPVDHAFHIFVAAKTLCILTTRTLFLTEGENGNPFSSSLFSMLGPGTMAGLTPFLVCRIIAYCLFAMDGFYKVIVSGLMASLTSLRADISLLRPDTSCRNENKKKNQQNG